MKTALSLTSSTTSESSQSRTSRVRDTLAFTFWSCIAGLSAYAILLFALLWLRILKP